MKKGGHSVPVKDILRRFPRSINNFWRVYRHSVNGWKIFLNSTDDFIQVAFRIGEEIEVVKKAQEENRQKGLPSVYSKNKIYYELPDGTITMKNPLPK